MYSWKTNLITPVQLRTNTRQIEAIEAVEARLNRSQFIMAAADGFRLAVHHGVLLEPVESDIEVIVPARTLNELSRLLGDQEDAVEIIMTTAKGPWWLILWLFLIVISLGLLGFLSMTWDSRRQGWHDKIAGTRV